MRTHEHAQALIHTWSSGGLPAHIDIEGLTIAAEQLHGSGSAHSSYNFFSGVLAACRPRLAIESQGIAHASPALAHARPGGRTVPRLGAETLEFPCLVSYLDA
jgi:hypothetical protein